jgi:DNA modification methylase
LSRPHQTPSGISNDSMGNRYDISQIPDESVHMIFTAPEHDPGYDAKRKKYIFEECSRVLAPGGVMVMYLLEYNPSSDFKIDYSKSQFQPGVNKYLHSLRKNDVYLTDRILFPYIPSRVFIDEKADHTSYRIYNNYLPFYIFRKMGIRAVPSEEIVTESRLTKEEQETWTLGVWKPVNDKEVNSKELTSRFIKMFSYRGDVVFNPFLQPIDTVKVAKELNRIGIDSYGKLYCKPEIKKDFGIELKGSGTKSPETLIQFFERAIGSESEDCDPIIETSPVNTGKTLKGIELAEESYEASIPV